MQCNKTIFIQMFLSIHLDICFCIRHVIVKMCFSTGFVVIGTTVLAVEKVIYVEGLVRKD